MQPNKTSPLALFGQPLQYLVPIFQRGYVWTVERQIQPLWADIVDRARELERYETIRQTAEAQGAPHLARQPRRHFLGTVIVTEHRGGTIGEPTTAEVIDGQQRMTTTQVLALAFRDAVADLDDEFLRQCMDTYTGNAGTYRAPHARYKVWPTNAGRQEMTDLVESRSFKKVCERYPVVTIGGGKSRKRVPRPPLVEAYLYFYGVIGLFLRGVDFDEVVPPEPGSLEALTDEVLLEAGHDVDRTLAAHWIHEIRHESDPKLPRSERPILPERIQLLISTLTEYVQLIELRLGADDDAQVIFESLNDRGERLTPADLVRNFVFLEATRKNASAAALYDQHWRDFDEAPAEKGAISKSKLFWKVDERQGRLTNTRLDTMLYHYVSMRTMNDVKLDHVFEEFKQWWLAGKKDVDQELARLKQAAAVFRAMVNPDRTTRLGRFAHNLRVLDSTTVTPVVLFLAERIGSDSDTFLSCLTVIESYLVRRAVCGRSTKAYNRVFPGLLKRLSEADAPTAALLAAHLQGLSGGETQDWPDDPTFQRAWLELNTYKALRTAKTKMLLEALELGSRNDVHHESAQLPSAALHVEHVLPVAWETHWPSPGDENAVLLRNHLLHNIGNLTLLTAKLNPSLSNSGFGVKRPEITKSLLALNAHFQGPAFAVQEPVWDESRIRERARTLFDVAARIWPFGAPTSSKP
ncbi:MAG: DUF262 domain-containing protein [Proteobacteria bacterium]|nr:DUF262 domain-containing protein [Pseudomonadota bacterium]